ncbi:hypothetical protein [Lawsonibacter hominis]|nr:hypothetical protein [Lawsonibacter hominis]
MKRTFGLEASSRSGGGGTPAFMLPLFGRTPSFPYFPNLKNLL